MPDEAIYYVDYIYNRDNPINEDNIYDIADMEALWGKDMDEPFIAVEGITIGPEDMVVYRKTTNTVKLTTKNGISLMIFKASDDDVEELTPPEHGGLTLNIVGRANRNEFNGYITPQIFVEAWEIVRRDKWVF